MPEDLIPESLSVIYPDAIVTRFVSTAAGAMEVFNRSGLCFFKYAITHALGQGLGTLNLGFLGADPLIVMVSGSSTATPRGGAQWDVGRGSIPGDDRDHRLLDRPGAKRLPPDRRGQP